MKGYMTIGALARREGLASETLRYYERLGLLSPSHRSSANYRLYDDFSLLRLQFIRRAQALGFSLAQVRELLTLHEQPEADMALVKELAQVKIDEIDAKIADLRRVRSGIKILTDQCPGHGPSAQCPILTSLVDAPRTENAS